MFFFTYSPVVSEYATSSSTRNALFLKSIIGQSETNGIFRMAGERKKIPFGCSLEIPNGFLGAIAPRSGLAHKFGIGLVNSWGVIDSSYRGEISAIIVNMGKEKVLLPLHTRIAQLLVIPIYKLNLSLVEENLNETDRGGNGFGSSGL